MSKPRQRFFSQALRPEDASQLTLEIRNIYELRNRLEEVTTDPNGSRTGIKGDLLLFNDSETYSVKFCTGSTVWQDLVSDVELTGDLVLGGANATYFGGKTTANSWRIIRSGNNLVVQRYESSVWTTKGTFTP